MTSDGHFKVELGDLENIDFKVQGFKTFVEKYLVYQNPQKYKKVSVKYNNQIVTTLNPYFKDNDSMLRNAPKIEIVKTEEKPVQLLAATPVKTEATPEPKKEAKKAEVKKESTKPKTTEKKSPPKSTEKKKETSSKPSSDKKKKAKVIVE